MLLRGGGEQASVVYETLLANGLSESLKIVLWDDFGVFHRRFVDNDVFCRVTSWPEAKLALGNVQNVKVYVCVGAPAIREKLVQNTELMMKDMQVEFPVLIHPGAWVAPSSKLGRGVFCGCGAVVNGMTEVGAFTIVNTAVVIEHDVVVGEYCSINPAVIVAGGCFPLLLLLLLLLFIYLFIFFLYPN
jgi:hypothetical protein